MLCVIEKEKRTKRMTNRFNLHAYSRGTDYWFFSLSIGIFTFTLSPSGGSGSWFTLRCMSSNQASRSCDFLLYWYHWGAMANAFLFLSIRRSYTCIHTHTHTRGFRKTSAFADAGELGCVCVLPSQCCTCCWAGCVWVWAALSCPHLELSSVDSLLSSVIPSPTLLHSPTHRHRSDACRHQQPTLPLGQCVCGRPCSPGNPPPSDFLPVWPPLPADPARSGLHCGTAPAPWLRLPSGTCTHVHGGNGKDANFIRDEEAWSVFSVRVWSLLSGG